MTKSTDLVVKSNSLVEARYKLTIWESRVFAKMVTMIHKDDKQFTTYEIGIRELMKFFETTSNNDFERIKKVPEALLKRPIKIPITDEGKKAFLVANIISSAIIPREEQLTNDSVLKLSFDPKLKPYLLELKKKFLKYDIKNVLRISSPHSVRIYELLKQFESTGWRQIEIQEFREILGIEDKYKHYANLKQRVLSQAQKDLEKYTDICFTFEEIKKGRRVVALKFHIYKNVPSRQDKKTKKTQPLVKLSQERLDEQILFEIGTKEIENKTIQALVQTGIDYDKALSLVGQYGDSIVLNELKHAQKTLKQTHNIANETGFIIKMIEKQSYSKAQVYKEAQEATEAKELLVQQQQQKAHKAKIDELRVEYENQRNMAVAEMVKHLDKEQIDQLVDEYGKKNVFLLKEIKKAEKLGKKEEAREHKYYLFAKELQEERMQHFEKYLELEYQYKLVRGADGEQILVSMK